MLAHSFDTFINKEKFDHIKRKFLYQDDSFDHPDAHISEVNINLDEITYVKLKKVDEPEILTLNFYKDYSPQLIIKISEKYKKDFIQTFEGNYSLLESGEDKFKRIELYKLNVFSNEIKNASHLIETLKDQLNKAIDELYEFIDTYKQKEVKDKIPFNLSKNEVITLFLLLHQKGYISPAIGKNDISRLIGRNFEYYNKTEKKYMPVIKPGKQVNNLLTDNGDDNPKLTLRKLKKIFTAKDFFMYDIATKNGDKNLNP